MQKDVQLTSFTPNTLMLCSCCLLIIVWGRDKSTYLIQKCHVVCILEFRPFTSTLFYCDGNFNKHSYLALHNAKVLRLNNDTDVNLSFLLLHLHKINFV